MKKIASLLILLVIGMSLFAGFDYRLDLLSFDPVHKEYMADKNCPNLQFNYIYNYEQFPEYVYQDSSDDHGFDPEVYYFYSETDNTSDPLAGAPYMGQMKMGETLSLFRSTFSFDNWLSPVTVDFSTQGVLNLVMEGEMADTIGYDGVFFFGTTISVADKFSLRFGKHHYCNHYGDAILKRISEVGDTGDDSITKWQKFWVTYKYVRMDGLALGLSLEPVEGVRVYGEYNWLPKDVFSWRPVIFRPSWIDINEDDFGYPNEYKARIINFGIELSYPIFKKLGKTTLAYDLHLYEEGKIVYRDENGEFIKNQDDIHYDPSRPWDREHGLVLNQEVSDTVSFEIGYHHGRAPLNLFWYLTESSWVYVGAKFNPDVSVTLFDTAK